MIPDIRGCDGGRGVSDKRERSKRGREEMESVAVGVCREKWRGRN